MEALIPVVVKC